MLENSLPYAHVFAHFGVAPGDRPAHSLHPHSPVFRCRVAGTEAVLKRAASPESAATALAGWTRALAARDVPVVTPLDGPATNPARMGEEAWVAYPWVEGRPYSGTDADIEAAGDLLGRLHAHSADGPAGVPAFTWPDHEPADLEAELDALRPALERHAPAVREAATARLERWSRTLMTQLMPALRDGNLPHVVASMDFKANNLVYAAGGPVLVDPENAEYAPRLLDLALALLLFHTESPAAPPRPFTPREWAVFQGAYRRHCALTAAEVALWPVAVRYMQVEWGIWTLLDATECDDWADPHQGAFLTALALAGPDDRPVRP
ncbi:phosphotransferase [Streptomyces sp. NPDC005722]